MDGRFYAQAAADRMRGVGDDIRQRAEDARGRMSGGQERAREMVGRYVNGIKASGATRAGQAVGRFVERMRGKIQERRARAGERAQEAPGGAVSRERRPDDARQG